jgi:osmoprotectant transport system permease protein
VATGLRAVPTIGIVMLLFRWRPVSIWPVLGALVVLAIPPIMLNTAAGVDAVERDVRDAARGVGLSPRQVLLRVELPCALPLVLAGLRSATNQVIATATIAGFGFGLGGLGRILYSGYGNVQYDKVYGGTVLVVALVLAVEVAFVVLQRRLVSPGLRAGRRSRPLPVTT